MKYFFGGSPPVRENVPHNRNSNCLWLHNSRLSLEKAISSFQPAEFVILGGAAIGALVITCTPKGL
jgi:hypothetical protein